MTLNKNLSIKISVLLMFILLGLSGCFSQWQGDLAKIVIFFGSGRAAYAPEDTATHQKLDHEITLIGKTETLNFKSKGTKTFEEYAAPGEYTIWVYSYLESGIYAAGTIDANLLAGQDNIITVSMREAFLVKFDSKGGSEVPDQIIITGNNAVKPSDPKYGDYSFEGWYKDESEWKELYDFNEPVTENITLYAKWIENIEQQTHLVSFNSNGGSNVDAQTVNHESHAVEPSAPTKTGYQFDGWYKDIDLTVPYGFNEPVTENITLYAKWVENIEQQTHTVSFNSDNGSVVADQTVLHNDKAVEPDAPTKSGYQFEGWYVDSGLTDLYNFDTSVTKDITLYAKWSLNDDNSVIEIIINMDEWELLEDPVLMMAVGGKMNFTIKETYAAYQWYMEGSLVGNASSYTFEPPSAGIYEIAVIVENSTGQRRSGSCQVIVR